MAEYPIVESDNSLPNRTTIKVTNAKYLVLDPGDPFEATLIEVVALHREVKERNA